jgi:hypothetical protein
MLALARSRYAVVVPAFQQHAAISGTSDPLDLTAMPGKAALRAAVQRQMAEAFNADCKACQRATDISRWLAAPSDAAPYAVNYTAGYVRLFSSAAHASAVLLCLLKSSTHVSHSCSNYLWHIGVTYRCRFEPFLLASRALLPPFDTRFRGYGLDRSSWTRLLHSSGFRWVVHHHFRCCLLWRLA